MNIISIKPPPLPHTFLSLWAALFLCVSPCILPSQIALAEPQWRPLDKISPIITSHQAEKAAAAGLPRERRIERLRVLGMEPAALDAEQCALYVSEKLSDQEIAELATKGIKVNPDSWVPPLPGRHPHGFHTATVAYAAIPSVRASPRIVYAQSIESVSLPLNQGARYFTRAEEVHTGNGIVARDGTGIRIAVADTGIDLSHADFPTPIETYDMTTGTSTLDWSTTVANTVMDHGTHVTGSALGRGTLSANTRFRGGAPGADLYFYKIGNNTTAAATDTDMIEAVNRALAVGCHIYSMSYGGVSAFMDGSSPVCQAIDNASASGMACVIAAGNDGDTNRHHSISVAPNTTTATFGFTVSNIGGGATYTGPEDLRVLWQDGVINNNMVLSCTNLGGGESLTNPWSSSSARGTEARQYLLTTNLGIGVSKTYNLRLQNTSVTGNTPLVHTWRAGGRGTFTTPDSSYTINHPGVADTAITIGAFVQSNEWRDWQNTLWQFQTWPNGGIAPFSSRGPRLDGWLKPNVVAPGAVTASCRDSGTFAGYPLNQYIIDNDGVNNGLGPANYYARWGTSMACPMAAGVAALLLQAAPGLTPAQLLSILESTASNAANPNNILGAGLIDIVAAIRTIDCNNNGVYDPIDVANQDCNSNGAPDDCDSAASLPAYTLAAYYPGSGQTLSGTPVAADLDGDGDGDDDLANGSWAFGYPVNVLWNNGNATFTQVNQFVTGLWYRIGSIGAGDFDGDDDIDLLVSQDSNPPFARTLVNDGTGTFSIGPILNVSFNTGPTLTVHDLNRDGYPDAVFLHSFFGVHKFGVMLNNGNGTFADPIILTLSQAAGAVRFADLDNDGYADAVLSMGTTVGISFNDGAGVLSAPTTYSIGTGFTFDVADVNMDGSIDVVARAIYYTSPPSGYSYLETLLNDGSGLFSLGASQNGLGLDGDAMIIADANGDLLPDVLVAGGNPPFSPLINDGSGVFTYVTPVLDTVGQLYGVSFLLDGDFDTDGKMDFVALQSGVPGRSILWGAYQPPPDTDCNTNGTPDSCDISAGTALDCQSDGIPDVCQLAENDCNGNAVPDQCDIATGGSFDTNGNGLPDECETASCATCPGDMDGDGDTDGGDLQGFTNCLLGGSALLTGCGCADMDANVAANIADLSLLADKLMTNAAPTCP